jgi:hypothetical protein
MYHKESSRKTIREEGLIKDKLISWFDDLSKSADKLADKEDQRKLKASFSKLQTTLYDLESNGSALRIVLIATEFLPWGSPTGPTSLG